MKCHQRRDFQWHRFQNHCASSSHKFSQGDHSQDNVKFPDGSRHSSKATFPDKIFSLTFPWFLVKSLTFPWQLWSSLTFPGFPDKWSPCILVKTTIAVDSDSGCLPRSPGQPQHHKYQNRIWWWQLTANRIDKRRSVRVSVGLQVSASFQIFAVRIWQLSTLGHAFGAPVRWVPVGILPWRLIRKK